MKKYFRRKRIALSVVIIGIFAVIASLIEWSRPQVINTEERGASIFISVTADTTAPLAQCFNVTWNLQNIKSLYMNETGKIGEYSEQVCDIDEIEFLVEFEDNTRAIYTVSNLIDLPTRVLPSVSLVTFILLSMIVLSYMPEQFVKAGMRALVAPAMIVLGICFAAAIAEIGLRFAYPTQVPQFVYKVYFTQADQNVGWIYRENFEFTWRGRETQCVEFEGQVETNRWGFRGDDWTLEKPDDAIRIALIGDSLIAALQMDVEDTAASRLEDMLQLRFPEMKFEVMNFGVSGFSVGQYNLNYLHHVREFAPDYVFVTVAYFQMLRNQESYMYSREADAWLKIRPVYVLTNDELELVPAADFQQFQDILDAIPQKIKKDTPLFTSAVWLLLNGKLQTQPPPLHHPDIQPNDELVFPQLEENYRILEALANQIQADGAHMIFVDIFDYFEYIAEPPGSGVLVDRNHQFASDNDVGYIDLSSIFRQSQDRVQFPCDQHLTKVGNRLMAESLFAWLSVEFEK